MQQRLCPRITAMKAIVIREHGGVDRLEKSDVPDPIPQAGEAVVCVRAVALNHLDLWVRRGVPGHTFHLPIIPGAEAAGVVEQISEGYGWKRGDEVIVAPGFSCGLCVQCLSGNDHSARASGSSAKIATA